MALLRAVVATEVSRIEFLRALNMFTNPRTTDATPLIRSIFTRVGSIHVISFNELIMPCKEY